MNNNPFTTTFGIEPNNLIKRITEVDKIINDFCSPSPVNYVYIITGLRGSGKTVLLTHISNILKDDSDWIVVDPGPKDSILENIASELYETGKMKKLFLKTEFNFSFHGIGLSIEGKEPVSSVISILKKMLDQLKNKNKRLLIVLDGRLNLEKMP